MKTLIFIFLLSTILSFSQTRLFPKIAFGKGVTCVYVGSGAVSRHLDWTRFESETDYYKRTPFIALGFDKCILPYTSNAYWGAGLYLSSWAAKREYIDMNNNRQENTWSNTLIAVRVTHHNTYFVREKLDMCSSLIFGAQIKYYHSKNVNEKAINSTIDRTKLYPAFGLTFTLRYYFYKNVGFYVEGCLGYKTDFASCGLVYKIH